MGTIHITFQRTFETSQCDSSGEKKALLSYLNPEIFLLQNLYGSRSESDQPVDELVKKLSSHFKSSIHIQAARYSFYNCAMKPSQSYSEWMATLRGIAKDCQFTCKSDACNHQELRGRTD